MSLEIQQPGMPLNIAEYGTKGAAARLRAIRKKERKKEQCPKCSKMFGIGSPIKGHVAFCKFGDVPDPLAGKNGTRKCAGDGCKRKVPRYAYLCCRCSGDSAELDRIVAEPRVDLRRMG